MWIDKERDGCAQAGGGSSAILMPSQVLCRLYSSTGGGNGKSGDREGHQFKDEGRGFLFYHSAELLLRPMEGIQQANTDGESETSRGMDGWVEENFEELAGAGVACLPAFFIFTVGTPAAGDASIPRTRTDIEADLHLGDVKKFFLGGWPSDGMASQQLTLILRTA